MPLDPDAVVDRIYEAALVPQLWVPVLDAIAALSGSASGSFSLASAQHGARVKATARVEDVLAQALTDADFFRRTPRIARSIAHAHEARFLRVADLLSAEEIEADPAQHLLRRAGLEAQSASNVVLPSGEGVCFTFERRIGQGLHTAADLRALDHLRPHLARAAVIATRLGLERAQMMVGALHAIGLPAAALAADGHVLAVNPAFECSAALRPAAFGKIAFDSPAVQALFDQALRQAATPGAPAVRSIPVPAGEDRAAQPPLVLHLLPIQGAAHDVFARTALVLIAMPFGGAVAVPELPLLHGLFDLTPAEARLAAALAQGQTLKQAAALGGIQYSTARTHLEHIFRKTGTRGQTQLVLLLQGARGLGQGAAGTHTDAGP